MWDGLLETWRQFRLGWMTIPVGVKGKFALTIGVGVVLCSILTAGLTLDGTVVITEWPGFGDGTYTLFDYTEALADNGLDLQASFLAAHPGSAIVNDVAGKRINLVVVPEKVSVPLLAW